MNNYKNVVIIKIGNLERSIRLPKEIAALRSEGYGINVLIWDIDCENINSKESKDYTIIELKLKSSSGFKLLLYLPIWWAFILYNLFILDYDIIHAIDIDSIFPALIAGKSKGKPVIYEMVDICEFELILHRRIMEIIVIIDKMFMKSANAVIVVDEMQALGLGGIPNPDVSVIYDSPPIKLINKYGACHIRDEFFTLFYAGIFFKSKRSHLDKVVEAIKELDNVKLIIAGYGDMIDDVKRWANDMPNKIEYIGKISYSDVFSVGKQADLMFILRDPIILANKYTCGSNMLNAMMLGKPILANRGTSTAEKVLDAKCGLVINSEDAKQIRDAIMDLKDNPELCHELGLNAKRIYDTKYSWDLMENRLKELYKRLINLNEGQ